MDLQATGDSGSGAFKGFAGFGSNKSAGGSGLFNFGAKPMDIANGSQNKSSADFKMPPVQSQNANGGEKEVKENVNAVNAKPKSSSNGETVKKSETPSKSRYLHNIKCLNESVTKWIKQHVDKNPHCILSPIFHDYEKHLAEIEKLNPANNKSTTSNGTEAKKVKEPPKETTATTGSTSKPGEASSLCRSTILCDLCC